jgi:hypothetical protein
VEGPRRGERFWPCEESQLRIGHEKLQQSRFSLHRENKQGRVE